MLTAQFSNGSQRVVHNQSMMAPVLVPALRRCLRCAFLLAVLAAATALVPAAASAQNHDRGGWQHNDGDRGDRGNRGDRADRGGNRARTGRRSARRPQPAPMSTARPAGRPSSPALAHNGRNSIAAPRLGPIGRPSQGGFQRPNAGRPAQVRPDGDWRAQAGGSHYADRDDRNDQNRNRGGQGPATAMIAAGSGITATIATGR